MRQMLASNQQTSELLYGHEKSENRRQELENKIEIFEKILENRVFREEKVFSEASKLQEQQIIQRNHFE